jgi:hypothetical protein
MTPSERRCPLVPITAFYAGMLALIVIALGG